MEEMIQCHDYKAKHPSVQPKREGKRGAGEGLTRVSCGEGGMVHKM